MDRDTNGRFVNGHAKTGGRKTRVDEDAFNRIWNKKFPQKKIESILDKLYALGMKGDLGALKIILEYLYGKPVDKREISGGDSPITIRVIYDNESDDD